MQESLFDDSPGEPVQTDTQLLIADWVDEVQALTGLQPPRATIGRMAKTVRALLETHPRHLLSDVLSAAAREGKGPAALPDLTLRVQTQGPQELLRLWVSEHGWPTGTRFKHTPSGGAYVRDPLGYDRPPYKVPWSSPTRDELRSALERLREKQGG